MLFSFLVLVVDYIGRTRATSNKPFLEMGALLDYWMLQLSGGQGHEQPNCGKLEGVEVLRRKLEASYFDSQLTGARVRFLRSIVRENHLLNRESSTLISSIYFRFGLLLCGVVFLIRLVHGSFFYPTGYYLVLDVGVAFVLGGMFTALDRFLGRGWLLSPKYYEGFLCAVLGDDEPPLPVLWRDRLNEVVTARRLEGMCCHDDRLKLLDEYAREGRAKEESKLLILRDILPFAELGVGAPLMFLVLLELVGSQLPDPSSSITLSIGP